MKKAWEDAEPGRAAKAQQSRLNYLNSRLQIEDSEARGDEVTEEELPAESADAVDAADATASPVPENTDEIAAEPTQTDQPARKEVLKPLDLSAFFR